MIPAAVASSFSVLVVMEGVDEKKMKKKLCNVSVSRSAGLDAVWISAMKVPC